MHPVSLFTEEALGRVQEADRIIVALVTGQYLRREQEKEEARKKHAEQERLRYHRNKAAAQAEAEAEAEEAREEELEEFSGELEEAIA